MYLRGWYEGCGEKCILQPLSRATEAARRVLPNKNVGKICGILGLLRPGGTVPRIWLAEGEELESNLLR
jgi:hypothetical protein